MGEPIVSTARSRECPAPCMRPLQYEHNGTHDSDSLVATLAPRSAAVRWGVSHA
jgi:hypothetical protein